MRLTFVFAASALSFAYASPMKRQVTCSPNFSTSVSIFDNDVEWTVASSAAGTPVNAGPIALSPPGTLYQFEQSGSSFLIKDSSSDTVVAVASDNSLELAQPTGDNSQLFSVSCESCTASGDIIASNCHILQTSTGLCAEITGSAARGSYPSLTDCENVVAQRFSFNATA